MIIAFNSRPSPRRTQARTGSRPFASSSANSTQLAGDEEQSTRQQQPSSRPPFSREPKKSAVTKDIDGAILISRSFATQGIFALSRRLAITLGIRMGLAILFCVSRIFCAVARRQSLRVMTGDAPSANPTTVQSACHRFFNSSHEHTTTVCLIDRLVKCKQYTVGELAHHLGLHLVKTVTTRTNDGSQESRGLTTARSKTRDHVTYSLHPSSPNSSAVGKRETPKP